MRIKRLWDVVPLPSKLRLAYSLVTLNLPTTIFFVVSLLQCIVQSGLHGWSSSHHSSFISQITEVAFNTQIVTRPLAVLSGDELFLCDAIPTFAGGSGQCINVVFQEQNQSPNATATSTTNNPLAQTLANGTQPDALSPAALQCAAVFPWVFQELRATSREDMLFITYQFWLFCISLLAILFQSIPHLMAALASGILASIATAFRIADTAHFKANFERIITNGSCHGIDLLPGYFPPRRDAEIVICIVNWTVFVVLAGLSYRLIQVYGQNSFEKVQRRSDMSRLYIVILSLTASVHLASFFIVASLGVMTDQLMLGPLRTLAQDRTSSIAIQVVIYVLITPWMLLGWTCGRVESKPRTAAFIITTAAILVLWAGSFTCSTYRFMFLTWDFFGAVTVAPGFLMIFILLLAIYIWFRLDLGLAAYLKHAEPPHPADKVRWSLAAMPDTEKSSPVDGPTKPSVTWYHPQSPKDTAFPLVAQGTPLPQPLALVAQTGRTVPMDITDSWLRYHIATSVVLSAPPTPNNSEAPVTYPPCHSPPPA